LYHQERGTIILNRFGTNYGNHLLLSALFYKSYKRISKKCDERSKCKADGVPIDRDKLQNRSPESFRDEDLEHRPTQ